MSNIVVTMTGNEAALFRSLQKLIGQEKLVETGFEKIAKAARKAGKDADLSFGQRAANDMARWAQSVASGGQVLAGLNRVLEDQKRLREEAAAAGRDLAKSQQETIKNLSGLTTAEKQAALAEAAAIADRTGAPQAAVVSAVGAGFSASGDIEKTLSAVEAAARLSKLTPEQLDTITSGALDVARGSGISDAERNLGFLLGAGGISRIEDPVKLSTNLAPVVSSGVETVPGQDRIQAAQQIAALFGGLTAGGTDRRGESSSTAAITMIAKLQQFFEKRQGDPGTIFGRIQALQDNAKLREEFLGPKGFGEERFKGPIQQILTEGSELSNLVETAADNIRFDAEVFRQHAEEVANLTDQLRMANLGMEGEQNIAQGRTPAMAAAGEARKILEDTLGHTQVSLIDYLTSWLNVKAFDTFGGDVNIAIDRLQQRLDKVETTEALGLDAIGSGDLGEMRQLLQEQLAVLRQMRDAVENSRRARAQAAPRPSSRPNQVQERNSQRE